MKNAPTQTETINERPGRLKKIWQCIWNTAGSIPDCPDRTRTAQDIRDECAAKCPWKGDLF